MSAARNRRSSIVPSMAEIKIDTDHPAPQSGLHSLDFDRVVNAYSIMSAKKHLVQHANKVHQNSVQHNRESQRLHKVIESYRSFKSDRSHERVLHTPHDKDYMRWILTVSVGIISGLVACLLVFSTSKIIDFRINRINWQLQITSGTASFEEYEAYYSDDPRAGYHKAIYDLLLSHGNSWILLEYILYNMVLALTSTLLCILFAPSAVGSGIPEVKAYLNGVSVECFADLNVFLTKIVGTIFAVSSGLIVGPEGPLVHIGAIVGQGITKTTRIEKVIRRLQQRRPVISRCLGCGKAPETNYVDEVALEPSYDKYLHNTARSSKQSFLEEFDYDEDEEEDVEENDDELMSLRVSDLDKIHDQSSISYQQQKPPIVNGQKEKGPSCKVSNTCVTDLIHIFSRFRNDCDRRDLISIGVATGFASAFGAPVGGLLYSLEEASSFFTIPLMWRTLVATSIATFVIAIYHGDLSHFSVLMLGDRVTGEGKSISNHFVELPLYILVGAMGGLLGAFFNASYLYINTVRKNFFTTQSSSGKKALYRILGVMCVSLLTSLVTFILPVYLPESWACTDVSKLPESDAEEVYFAARYNCPVGQFNEIATILIGSRDEALNDIFTDPSKFEPKTLLLCGMTFLFLMVITFGIFIPSGLFMPTLLTGSALSAYFALLIQRHLLPELVPEHFALVGATAMLAGVQRSTVSLCVIMMEATGQTKVLIPLIIAVVVARYVGDLFNDGFYHIVMHMKHYPFLEHEIKETFDICSVSDVMTSPVVSLQGVEEAETIQKVLSSTNFEAFPVHDQHTKGYAGLIRRDQLIALLEAGIYLESLDDVVTSGRESMRVRAILTQAESGKGLNRVLLSDADTYASATSLRDSGKTKILQREREWLNDNVFQPDRSGSIVITSEELPGGTIVSAHRGNVVDIDSDGKLIAQVPAAEKTNHVDVAAAMNRGAFTVTQNCPLSKAYSLFAAMGLRHLPVLGIDGTVVGMITRSNLNPEYMEERTRLDMHH